MKRIRITGLCLVAVFAFSALVASAAQAALPEYRTTECKAQKKGNFTESGCKTVAEKKGKPDHKGSYELVKPAGCVSQKKGNYTESGCKTVAEKKGKPDHKGGFERTACYPAVSCGSFPYKFESTKGTTTITTHSTAGAPETVVCAKGKNAGEYTSPQEGFETITFEGCENAEHEKCTTGSLAAGTIETGLLNSLLEYINAPENEVGELVWAAGGNVVQFSCGAATIVVEGYVVGAIANTPGIGETITFAVTGGKQAHQAIWEGTVEYPGYKLFTNPGEVESTLETVELQTGAGVNP